MKETEKCQIAMKLPTTNTEKAVRFRTVKPSVIILDARCKLNCFLSVQHTQDLLPLPTSRHTFLLFLQHSRTSSLFKK